ncbi:Hypothetical_protein [Hexamita inflata]|uniref:Hypothetical_protein n=1 Tax=Hexamita inflata TaxID=28002 RepID=A0AA86NNT2_9EUKA|nr:Hypothetical protein HINF_LOCUS10462 [Hexamita inflata]
MTLNITLLTAQQLKDIISELSVTTISQANVQVTKKYRSDQLICMKQLDKLQNALEFYQTNQIKYTQSLMVFKKFDDILKNITTVDNQDHIIKFVDKSLRQPTKTDQQYKEFILTLEKNIKNDRQIYFDIENNIINSNLYYNLLHKDYKIQISKGSLKQISTLINYFDSLQEKCDKYVQNCLGLQTSVDSQNEPEQHQDDIQNVQQLDQNHNQGQSQASNDQYVTKKDLEEAIEKMTKELKDLIMLQSVQFNQKIDDKFPQVALIEQGGIVPQTLINILGERE